MSGEDIYVVWQDTSPANDIFVSSSDNGGNSFSEPINVSNTTDGSSSSPQIAVSGEDIYVVWQDTSSANNEILFATSNNGGSSFTEPVNISNTTAGVSVLPQIAVSPSGTIFVVWQDTSPSSDIFIASSGNGGANFTSPINVSNTDEGGSFSPRVAVNDDAVFVVWLDSNPGNTDIFFGASRDGGSSFNVTNISENDGVSVTPSLIVDGATGKIYVTWSDNTGTGGAFDVFVSSSTDRSDFSDPVNVSANSGQSTLPQVHLISGTDTVYLAWMDNTLDITNQEILLGPSPDGGETFGCAINVSNNPTTSSLPQLIIAPNSETVHVVWQDPIEPDNSEVLLRSGLVPAETSMTIDEVSNTTPKWDVDVVQVSGTVGSGADPTDTVTVNWGDGTATEEIPVDGCDWGPVSHPYPSSALVSNPNQLSAALFSANGTQKATASPAEISVQKHSATLTLNPVQSVVQGSEVSVVGSLEDSDAAEGIGGQNITFSGTGAVGILQQATTESGGDAGAFSATGAVQNATGSLQSVQAHFAGSDLYEAAESVVRAYDVVSASAVQFNVTAADPLIDLAGFFAFNATIEFDELLSDGAVFVSECESPASDRYSSLDLCLSISSAVEMAEDTFARVEISYDGKLPQGASPEQVDMFHEELTTDGVAIVDITE
ncbi:MAG TPA: sialidase family protein, partial [Nitrososphaera sp.]